MNGQMSKTACAFCSQKEGGNKAEIDKAEVEVLQSFFPSHWFIAALLFLTILWRV